MWVWMGSLGVGKVRVYRIEAGTRAPPAGCSASSLLSIRICGPEGGKASILVPLPVLSQ